MPTPEPPSPDRSAPAGGTAGTDADGAPVTVVFLIEGLGTGGAERSLAELLPEYRRHGIRSVVARFHDRPEGVEAALRAAGEDIRPVPGRGRAARLRAVRRLLRAERPALLHTTHFEADVVGRLAAAGTDIPVLTTLASPPYLPVRLQDRRVHPAKLRAVRAIDGLTARHLTAHIHAVSEAVATQAVTALGVPRRRITVVHRGRDRGRLGEPTPARRAAARHALGCTATQPVLLAVGRHEYAKGHIDAVRALPVVRARHPDVVLVIAGRDGATSGELRAAIAELDLADHARLLGHRDDIGDLLCAADVLVAPSLYEGSPGAVLEAMAMAVPVVASDFAGVGEVVRPDETGIVVPMHAPEALGTALADLLDDDGRRRALGDAGRAAFEAHHSMAASGAAMASLLRRVAAAGRHPR